MAHRADTGGSDRQLPRDVAHWSQVSSRAIGMIANIVAAVILSLPLVVIDTMTGTAPWSK
jgi:hypothetical protein